VSKHCDCPKNDDECSTCGSIHCPEGEPLHYHHDGCPSCESTEGALARLEKLVVPEAGQTLTPPLPWTDVAGVLCALRDIRARWRNYVVPLLKEAQALPPTLCLHPAHEGGAPCDTTKDGDMCWVCGLRTAVHKMAYYHDPDAWDEKVRETLGRAR